MSDELIGTARRLARASPRKPRQSDLQRAVSTAYFALFHALAKEAADLLVGTGAARRDAAWTHTYRALEHGFARNACTEIRRLALPPGITGCALAFLELQEARHSADYDPNARFTRTEALDLIGIAETAIRAMRAESRLARKAFLVRLLLRRRP